jgi:hypothetical protein
MANVSKLIGDEALTENTGEYIHGYLSSRLICKDDQGNEVSMRESRPDIYAPFFEVALDMFHSGADWADVTSGREHKLPIIQVTKCQ